jgi:hypothetical protein
MITSNRNISIKFVHGPTLSNSSIDGNDCIVYIDDHYDPFLLNQIQQQHPNTLIIQSFFCVYPQKLNSVLWIPFLLNNLNTKLFLLTRLEDTVETLDCFNFMIYKCRNLRLQTLKFIEENNYQTAHYTFKKPVTNLFNFSTKSRVFGDPNSDRVRGLWEQFLAENVFLPTAVSLITETIEPEWGPCMTFTEKTAYSVLGLTFPIWLGGYRQAETWAKFGFDTFNDVIDHRYQYQIDPVLSIKQALNDNNKILKDLNYAKSTRSNLLPRLIQNRQRFLNYNFQTEISNTLKENCPSQALNIEKFLKGGI